MTPHLRAKMEEMVVALVGRFASSDEKRAFRYGTEAMYYLLMPEVEKFERVLSDWVQSGAAEKIEPMYSRSKAALTNWQRFVEGKE